MYIDKLPEVFVSNKNTSNYLHRAIKDGSLKKIGPKLYTKNLTDEPKDIIKKYLWFIVSEYFPDGLISDRTAIEGKPSKDGTIYIISEKTRNIKIPGYLIKPRKGIGSLSSDHNFIDGLKICSRERAFLENMRESRVRNEVSSRTLSQKEIEEKFEGILRVSGEQSLNEIRDKAYKVVKELGEEDLYNKLDKVIGLFFGTKQGEEKSELLLARKKGIPFDPERLALFQKLYSTLKNTAPQSRIRINPSLQEKTNLSFFEAYFSNFIEGTEFEIEEAEEIIFENKIVLDRPEDSHDVLGTFQVISSLETTSTKNNATADFFVELLKKRHALIMEKRLEVHPGKFKRRANRAGSTYFVDPQLVEGTLIKGFEFIKSLDCPLHKAIFTMFLITETHPFDDGNGRIARIMMNDELIRHGEYPIIIPIVYRNNYLSALKTLSANGITEPLIRVLDFAQKYTSKVDWSSLKAARMYLEKTNAFVDPQRADFEGVRLTII